MSVLRFPAGLYGVTPEWDDTERLIGAVRLAASGGMRALQLRRKKASPVLRKAQARALAPVCHALNLVFIINDDWQLALEVGADGAHLGRDDDEVAIVRQQAPNLLLGASCYDELDRARRLLDVGVDYIALGSVFVSSTKPEAARVPLSFLRQARQLAQQYAMPRPAVVAIGGIGPHNAAMTAQAGADVLAVISALFEAPSIRDAAAICSAPYQANVPL
jgi:thiamine-phosphate pyrophosphorylase